MSKRKMMIALAAVLSASVCHTAFAGTYSDVPQSHWACSEIEKAGRIGFMSGMGDGTFGLGQNVTRAQFASMLVRMFGWEQQTGSGFSDVSESEWFYKDVMTAQAMGVADGTSFRPNDNITREEMAVMLVKALGYDELAKSLSDTSLPFKDVSTNKGYISLAYDFGIISGRSADTFDPNGTALREDAAAMMTRCYDRYNSYTDFLHGFYAFSSYSQRNMAKQMDAVSFGWGRMEYSDENGIFVNTTSENGNEWRVPEGYTDIVDLLENSGVDMNLSIFMSADEGDDAQIILSDAENRTAAVNAVIDELTVEYRQLGRNPYGGVTIDFEALRGSAMRENYTAFLRELKTQLDGIGKSLYVTVQPKLKSGAYYDGYDYGAIGSIADKVILMAYDYNAKTVPQDVMESGFTTTPVTPFDEVYYSLKAMTNEISDRSKIVLGMSINSIGWTVSDGKITNSRGNIYSYDEIEQMIADGAEVRYSDKYKNPYIIYDNGGEREIVWYENEQSIDDKIKLAGMFGIDGVSVWRLGLIPDDIWIAIKQ
ncbi:MAG: S-layer homology domain-containing protein [Clostridia bacterium]|nr:S-layer homology domain-containing protein [Clostridia bacterium]